MTDRSVRNQSLELCKVHKHIQLHTQLSVIVLNRYKDNYLYFFFFKIFQTLHVEKYNSSSISNTQYWVVK